MIGLTAKDVATTLWALLASSTAAAWRWGYPLAAAVASVASLCLLARVPGGRLLWIVAGLTLPPLLLRASDSARLPASQRASARVVAGVALLGLYFAFHIGSWDHPACRPEQERCTRCSEVYEALLTGVRLKPRA